MPRKIRSSPRMDGQTRTPAWCAFPSIVRWSCNYSGASQPEKRRINEVFVARNLRGVQRGQADGANLYAAGADAVLFHIADHAFGGNRPEDGRPGSPGSSLQR